MTLKFNSFDVGSIGDLIIERRAGWSSVRVGFYDSGTGGYPSVTVEVPLEYKHDWTIAQVREAVLARAVIILREAGDMVSSRELKELQAMSDENEAAGDVPHLDDDEVGGGRG